MWTKWSIFSISAEKLRQQLKQSLSHRLPVRETAIVILCVETALQGSWDWIYEVWTAWMESSETQHQVCFFNDAWEPSTSYLLLQGTTLNLKVSTCFNQSTYHMQLPHTTLFGIRIRGTTTNFCYFQKATIWKTSKKFSLSGSHFYSSPQYYRTWNFFKERVLKNMCLHFLWKTRMSLSLDPWLHIQKSSKNFCFTM